eukprot:GHVU01170765.1.p1 GENE.GHVU01170765.1~~GHVU01170765.1.p1  ORF type:complete len:110 (+),score=5.50 GHVU01170765.1:260-589(+)
MKVTLPLLKLKCSTFPAARELGSPAMGRLKLAGGTASSAELPAAPITAPERYHTNTIAQRIPTTLIHGWCFSLGAHSTGSSIVRNIKSPYHWYLNQRHPVVGTATPQNR